MARKRQPARKYEGKPPESMYIDSFCLNCLAPAVEACCRCGHFLMRDEDIEALHEHAEAELEATARELERLHEKQNFLIRRREELMVLADLERQMKAHAEAEAKANAGAACGAAQVDQKAEVCDAEVPVVPEVEELRGAAQGLHEDADME